ncbi:pyridoxamine 5'-phosphate oxidase family protein [Candidatus Uhrbacteria bacterium CG10_big_fil_rev_8_21_14_0_10_48_11]|uniref:Pyridoxamine 5'-phosphate oxidase family protein n=1 Tax=Candidatus Uhrbacteria bacterium CG10_big_fil_rev_8_21_14_0_10_48_11 TaxID=1975037 RepID=A0A2M8LDG1_9BACT|nr:MAG: pyridoxamine 5'-phosphate oxidase family protein [Candidatus Uhrbacteria bacterium CG10_big_fil_rev_8_21_14_0_10_48_11]
MADAQNIFETVLLKSDTCTLATASLKGKPEAATIQYAADEMFRLYFESFPSYRKYKNISVNPQASVVVTREGNTVQMDGVIVELSGKDAEAAKQQLVAKFGIGIGYLLQPDVLFFRFTPTWIRVLVSGTYPPKYVIIKE